MGTSNLLRTLLSDTSWTSSSHQPLHEPVIPATDCLELRDMSRDDRSKEVLNNIPKAQECDLALRAGADAVGQSLWRKRPNPPRAEKAQRNKSPIAAVLLTT